MNIIIITQNEPFYLKENLNFLIENLPPNHKIVGVVVTDVSPFGKKETFINKARTTLKIFGSKFFIYYSIKFIKASLFKSSIKSLLKAHRIPVIPITGSINSKNSLDLINSYKPDLLVSILGNQIFKKQLLNLTPKGCINLHTALLPKYRGLMPSFWVLKNNEKYTGVSVFIMDEGIDSGPILIQKKIPIRNKTQQQLIKETKHVGMKLILKSIELIDKDEFQLIENPDSEKSYYTFPTRKDVLEFRKMGKKFF